MLEKELLRKADVFSGAIVTLVGLFIIGNGLTMPMKDSWGGVQNVWFVSPALFPLFVGAMLVLLGVLLMRTALRAVGREGLAEVFGFLASSAFLRYLRQPATIRYYGIVVMLVVFVFLLIPKIDFFLAAIFFLLALFTMYYSGEVRGLPPQIWAVLAGSGLLVALFALGLLEKAGGVINHPGDWLLLAAIIAFALWRRPRQEEPELWRKYRIGLVVALIAPITVGIIFKYLLYVPLPHEGLVVQLLDAIWYAEFWS